MNDVRLARGADSAINQDSLIDVTIAFPASYQPPAGDRLGERIKHRAWTYDIALAATAGALDGELDGSGALLDALQARQRPDGALEASYTLSGDEGAGPLRSGNQAWVGLAALQWRMLTCSGRHDRLLAGVARWLLAQRIDDPDSPGFGLLRGGPDVSWASTEHNLEARAFFAGLADTFDGRHCPPGLDEAPSELSAQAHEAVVRLDHAIEMALLVRDGDGRSHLRQGLGDDARPLDVQALGMLWLIGRVATATRAPSSARRTRRCWCANGASAPPRRPSAVTGRSPTRGVRTCCGWRGRWMMRLAKARLGSDTAYARRQRRALGRADRPAAAR